MSPTRFPEFTKAGPIPAEVILRRADKQPKGSRPSALNALDSPRLVSSRGDAPPKLERVAESGIYRLAGDKATVDIPAGKMKAWKLPKRGKKVAAASPKAAKWAGTSFHPRVSPDVEVAHLRRRSGTNVHADHTNFGGVEHRTTFYPAGYPWHCIGRLSVSATYRIFGMTFSTGWSGSGALVGRRVVLTASHVVPWGASSWSCRFTPASYDGVSTLGSTVFSWVRSARGYRDHDQGDDMAILRLWDSLGSSLGYFGAKTYDDDWEDTGYWTLIGYHGDLSSGNRPSYQSGVAVYDDDSDGAGVELEHSGDRSGGASGGPLFGWWSNGPHVIGAHSGEEDNWLESHNHVAAGGSALVSLISGGRSDWD